MQLFDEFPSISTDEWMKKIEADLKGADFKKKLVWKSPEGLPVQPFYREEDLKDLDHQEGMAGLKPGEDPLQRWTICQDIFPGMNGTRESAARIQSALKGGAQSLRICLADVSSVNQDLISALLEDVDPGITRISFQGYLGADALLNYLKEFAAKKGVAFKEIKASLGADPLCKMLSTGIPVASFASLGRMVKECNEEAPGIKVIDVNGGRFQNAGASLAQELAFTLSMANDYLATLTEQGISAEQVIQSMQLSIVSGPDYFMEIAKIRALRLLWAALAKAYGVEGNAAVHIHSTTSTWNMSLYDPHVNMLRATTETMSAILGGADTISVLPYDHSYGKSTEFSDRVARNVQIILRDEAYFGRVADPSAGSYYIENLTDALAGKAWELFQETEKRGGFRKALQEGWIQREVEASRNSRLEHIRSGREHILGTNAFPAYEEFIATEVRNQNKEEVLKPIFRPLKPFRAAEAYEHLRLDTERSGKRPKVFLFKHGSPAWVSARATFSGNFFACAGYEIINLPSFGSIKEGLEAMKKAEAEVIVLCSSDDGYTSLAPEVAGAIAEGSLLVVAGNPADTMEQLKADGVKHFIHVRSKLLDTLQEFNRQLL